jgi:hypothetical protein
LLCLVFGDVTRNRMGSPFLSFAPNSAALTSRVSAKPAMWGRFKTGHSGPGLWMLYLSAAFRASLISDIFGVIALFFIKGRKKIVSERRRRIFMKVAMV